MKCAGAETLLRAVLDSGDASRSEGVRGAQRRVKWLKGQDAVYLQELEDACYVLGTLCKRALEDLRRVPI